MSNLALIRPQRVDFDTQQSCDWLDGLPLIGTAGLGGTVPGSANVGNGTVSVAGVANGTAYGAHIVAVTAIGGGLTYLSVTDPAGIVTAQGVAGAPLYAGGITLSLSQGTTPFAVGDTFAIGVLPVAVDLTGLRFDLDSRISAGSSGFAIQASTATSPATIANGNASGLIAMQVPRATLAACPVSPAEGYPYAILASDPVTGLTVPAFYGLIFHTAVAAQIGQGS
ncbi:hypothetical protein ABIE45_003909 [Methylobacterium sp. OAE515]|uniref:hypothetical protein n=1 Tax=Methylobacterium sp. OAE515 TaxID=2817895 RepID=UPI00178A9A7B